MGRGRGIPHSTLDWCDIGERGGWKGSSRATPSALSQVRELERVCKVRRARFALPSLLSNQSGISFGIPHSSFSLQDCACVRARKPPVSPFRPYRIILKWWIKIEIKMWENELGRGGKDAFFRSDLCMLHNFRSQCFRGLIFLACARYCQMWSIFS